MKLPKGMLGQFGGGDLSGMLSQAQAAMERAKNLEAELAKERVETELNGVKVTHDGTGELVALTIDPALVDPEDVEGLEAAVAAAIRAGFTKATELRSAKTNEIMPDIPGLGQLGLRP